MKSIYDFDDIHSHGYPANDSKIVNLDYDEDVCYKGYYSIGIHPWRTADQNFDAAAAIESVRQKAVKANVIAIGECGIDKLRGANIDLQKDDIFELDDETYIMLDNRNYEPYESNLEKGINILKTIKETIPFI